MNERGFGAAPVVAAALATAGCGTAGTNTEPERPPAPPSRSQAPVDVNRVDITFASDMIPHHDQAVRMADMVPSRTDDAALRDLAERIRRAQRPEIDRMTGWLRDWQPPTPSGGGHDSTDGMMSAEDMALDEARGHAFEEMWLRMVIEHHEGAVTMARTEFDEGRNDAARELARGITESQRSETAETRAMLG
ncbi:uncharacterized protein (DUF305 family) [Saccharopolyspora lacisalsi]|uniref:Uncharacterized protein (DUF305 family) n=1 Tax=Halosaccharopolyspora lacisalsi TaxID=1000566 RepID=A0A839E2L0_9PSEU|nr:DUF305 domain-containing protein [Halosaccharopolyspora lacisalsi]MBA8827280.1 uncharacterized protein (DUF305 family) [Halosaccharopolyspora lacisalsi]